MFIKFILILIFFISTSKANDNSKHKNDEIKKADDSNNNYNNQNPHQIQPPQPHTTTTPSSQQNYYPNGNIRFEMVGNSSSLFEAEDFQKIEVKPLRSINSALEEKSIIENDNSVAGYDHIVEEIDQDGNIIQTTSNENLSSESNQQSNDKVKPTIECNLKKLDNETSEYENKVKIVNGSELTSILAESKSNDCFVVMFYVQWCPFSIRLAPNFNALPRAFKQLDILAFDVSKSTGYNTKFGTNAVPMVLIFQQKNVIAKFNHTQKNLTHLIEFVSKNTGINGNSSIELTNIDLEGPVPTVITEKFDYGLLFSWIFLLFFALKLILDKFNLYIHIKRIFMKYFMNNHEHNE